MLLLQNWGNYSNDSNAFRIGSFCCRSSELMETQDDRLSHKGDNKMTQYYISGDDSLNNAPTLHHDTANVIIWWFDIFDVIHMGLIQLLGQKNRQLDTWDL